MTKPLDDRFAAGDAKRSRETGAYSKFASADVVLAALIAAAATDHSVADSWFGFQDSRSRSLVAGRVRGQPVWAKSGAMPTLRRAFFCQAICADG